MYRKEVSRVQEGGPPCTGRRSPVYRKEVPAPAAARQLPGPVTTLLSSRGRAFFFALCAGELDRPNFTCQRDGG